MLWLKHLCEILCMNLLMKISQLSWKAAPALHFTDKETKSQRSHTSCPRPHR